MFQMASIYPMFDRLTEASAKSKQLVEDGKTALSGDQLLKDLVY